MIGLASAHFQSAGFDVSSPCDARARDPAPQVRLEHQSTPPRLSCVPSLMFLRASLALFDAGLQRIRRDAVRSDLPSPSTAYTWTFAATRPLRAPSRPLLAPSRPSSCRRESLSILSLRASLFSDPPSSTDIRHSGPVYKPLQPASRSPEEMEVRTPRDILLVKLTLFAGMGTRIRPSPRSCRDRKSVV